MQHEKDWSVRKRLAESLQEREGPRQDRSIEQLFYFYGRPIRKQVVGARSVEL